MPIRYLLRVLPVAFLLLVLPCSQSAQTPHKLGTWLDERGSVPPIPQWFACMRELDDQPYDKKKSQSCLDSILSHPESEKGKLIFKRYKVEDVLTFRVEWPSLTVTDVDLGVGPSDLAKVHELLAINGRALRPGAIYEFTGEASTRLVLDLLLRSQGRRAGISRTVSLDYKEKTAQVTFKLWEGPRGNPEPLVPPYAEPCKILNDSFAGTDIDDFSPATFVERMMKTQWTGCFSETDLHDDLTMLKGMKFLTEANISVNGSGKNRGISIHLRSNPIPIECIRVKGYGLLDTLAETDMPPLTIHVGDTYRRSASRNLAEQLKKMFMKDDRRVRVFTDVQITPDGKANLEFGVLAYPNDLVYVNGAKFNGSFPDNPDIPD